MSSATSNIAEIFAVKSTLRKHILLTSKAICKSSSAWRGDQSEMLCTKLWESPAFAPLRDIETRYIDALNAGDGDEQQSKAVAQSQQKKAPSEAASKKKPFCIGLYMSLWFEIDVDPLLHRLLAVRELPQLIMQQRMMQLAGGGGQKRSSAEDDVGDRAILDLPPAPRIFVPELVPVDNVTGSSSAEADTKSSGKKKSEMRFVEIMSAADLEKNFVPVPPFNIREPPKVENDPMWRSRGYISTMVGHQQQQQQKEGAVAASSSDASDLDVLIVPGVAFDFDGNRLGMGGGYYDRWINRSTCANDSAKAGTTGDDEGTIFVGVGFDEQLPRFSKQAAGDESNDAGSSTLKEEQKKSFWDGAVAPEDQAAEMLKHAVPMVPGVDMPLHLVVTPSHVVMGK